MSRGLSKLNAESVESSRWLDLTGDQRLIDGGGLSLLVRQHSKTWRFRYRHPASKKPNELSLGAYPDVTLKQARAKLAAARSMVANGLDPSERRQVEREAAQQAHARAQTKAADSFKTIAEAFLRSRKDLAAVTLTGEFQRLEAYVYPKIGSTRIGEVTVPALREVLVEVETQAKLETAARVRSLIGRILRYARQHGHETKASSEDMKGVLARRPATGGFAAITNADKFAGLLHAIDGYPGQPVTRLALKLMVLTCVRSRELREATWSEFQLDSETPQWTIPAERMKMDREHIVPLAPQAVALLKELQAHAPGPLVFPALRPGRPLSENTLNSALRLLGYDRHTHVTHGFRKSFSTLLHEMGWDHRVIEAQLAHREAGVSGIYNRALYLPERRKMMQAWADYLDSLMVRKAAA